jgi:hypothetical protein
MERNTAIPTVLRRKRRRKQAPTTRRGVAGVGGRIGVGPLDNGEEDWTHDAADRDSDDGSSTAASSDTRSQTDCADPLTQPSQQNEHDEAMEEDPSPSSGPNISTVLPSLLHLREIGLLRKTSSRILPNPKSISKRMEPWKSMLLHYRPAPGSYLEKERNNSPMIHNNLPVYHFGNDESYSNIQLHKQLWRSYTKQSIPFSQLKTPLSDAILAMDRWGSYMIGVGGGDLTRRNDSKGGICPLLSLKFYGESVFCLVHIVATYPNKANIILR